MCEFISVKCIFSQGWGLNKITGLFSKVLRDLAQIPEVTVAAKLDISIKLASVKETALDCTFKVKSTLNYHIVLLII